MTTSDIANLCWSQCWQITALIGIVALLGATVFRHRPHLAHLLWIIVIVKCLTLPLWSSPTGVFSWLQPSSPQVAVDDGYLTPAPSPFAVRRGDREVTPTAAIASPVSDSIFSSNNLITAGLMIWAMGVMGLLGLALRRWIEVYRLVSNSSRTADEELEQYARQLTARLKMKSRVRVLISESNLGPMVFGSYRPVVILPEAMTTEKTPKQLQPIVAHELLHARRGDTTFGALQFIAQVVWWFHPLVWWACRQANRVSERCCDEEVIANLGCKPSEYARCLLDALELKATLNATPGLPGIRAGDITSNRVVNLMKNENRFRQATPRRYWLYAVVLALLVFPGGRFLVRADEKVQLRTVSDSSQALAGKAERAAANGKWDEAAETYRAITERDETDGRAWFMLGYCLHASGKLDEAIVAHKRAATFARAKPTASYNLACAYALTDDRESAIEALGRAIEAGFISPTPIGDDADFASLKDDPAFAELAAAAKPHSDREIYRQFDFWVGTWDVFGRDGQKVGTNVVTKNEKGFLLTEKWTDVDGGTGTSINYYDPTDRRWKQTWVDAGGNIVHYSGEFSDGKMELKGRLSRVNGVVVASRVTYSRNDDGSVRQLIERSRDNGKTWSTYFDGRYVLSQAQNTEIPADTAATGASSVSAPS